MTSVQVLIDVGSQFHVHVSSQRQDGGLFLSGIEKQYSSCFQQVGPLPRFLTRRCPPTEARCHLPELLHGSPPAVVQHDGCTLVAEGHMHHQNRSEVASLNCSVFATISLPKINLACAYYGADENSLGFLLAGKTHKGIGALVF